MSWACLFCKPTEADGPESGRMLPILTVVWAKTAPGMIINATAAANKSIHFRLLFMCSSFRY
jgi:hypothetical protein